MQVRLVGARVLAVARGIRPAVVELDGTLSYLNHDLITALSSLNRWKL